MQKGSIDDKEEGVCVPHPISFQSLVVLIYFQSKLNAMNVYCSGTPPYDHSVNGATSRFVSLEKFSLKSSSSSFRIRVNLRHPDPSLFLLGLLSPLWCFSILRNYYFVVVILDGVKNDSKCRDVAPLI